MTILGCGLTPLLAEGLRSIFAAHPDLSFQEGAADPGMSLQQPPRGRPDIVLVDGDAQPDPYAAIARLRSEAPGARAVLWMRGVDQAVAERAVEAGAWGALCKTRPVNVLLTCLRTVARGGVWIGDWEARELSATPWLL